MKETVPVAQATNGGAVLPERVQEALGELVGAAKDVLLAVSVGRRARCGLGARNVRLGGRGKRRYWIP